MRRVLEGKSINPLLLPRGETPRKQKLSGSVFEQAISRSSAMRSSVAASTLFASASSINQVLAQWPYFPADVTDSLRTASAVVFRAAVDVADGVYPAGW